MLLVHTAFTLYKYLRLCAFHSPEGKSLRASCCWVRWAFGVKLCGLFKVESNGTTLCRDHRVDATHDAQCKAY